MERIGDELGLAMMFCEDVGGHWAGAFGMRGPGQAWRFLDPEGTLSWKHDGRIPGEALAAALNHHLVLSGAPRFKRDLPVADRRRG